MFKYCAESFYYMERSSLSGCLVSDYRIKYLIVIYYWLVSVLFLIINLKISILVLIGFNYSNAIFDYWCKWNWNLELIILWFFDSLPTSPSLWDFVQLSTLLSQKPSGRTTITEAAEVPKSIVDSLMQDLATRHAPLRASTIRTNPFLFVSSLTMKHTFHN